MIGEIVFEMIFKIRYIIQSKGFGDQFRDFWMIYDWIIITCLVVLAILDMITNAFVYIYYLYNI